MSQLKCDVTVVDYKRDCACKPGWQGDGKIACEDVDECSLQSAHGKPYACLNGTCTNTIGSFTCDCSTGFAGEQCDIVIDACASGPCANGGTCKNTDGGYTCTCPASFTGTNCESRDCDFCAKYCSASSSTSQFVTAVMSTRRATTGAPAPPLQTTTAKTPSPPRPAKGIVIVGGLGAQGNTLVKEVEAYDFATGYWSLLADFPSPRYGVGAATLNGRVYAVGGVDGTWNEQKMSYVYDAAIGNWTKNASTTEARFAAPVTALDGKLYVVSGISHHTGQVQYFENFGEQYDGAASRWYTGTGTMNNARAYFGLAVLGGGLYAVGGSNVQSGRGVWYKSVERHDPATFKWTLVAPMSTERNGLAVAVVGDRLFAIGGANSTTVLATVEAYDAAKDQWSPVASLNEPRVYGAAVAHEGRIYVVGGQNSRVLDTMEVYDPKTDAWTVMPSWNRVPRYLFGATLLPAV